MPSSRLGGLAAVSLLLSVGLAAASPISDKYASLGGTSGFLGAPTGPESEAPDGSGRLRHYQNGDIYWSPETAAHEVHGLILAQYNLLNAEIGLLRYPMSDELNTFDLAGRVSKFQMGELIWHSATNLVSEVKTSDLVVDLPFPQGQPWFVIQANGIDPTTDSHFNQWVYCWDFMLAGQPQSNTENTPFTSAATARIVWVDQQFAAGEAAGDIGNTVVQRLGQGKYASYLHLTGGSYTSEFAFTAQGRLAIFPQILPWQLRPIARAGTVLATAGDTGANIGAFHLHFCVTTSPDRSTRFAPFESVPVAFQNFDVSTDSGTHWKHVDSGVPKRSEWVRRDASVTGQTSPVNNDSAPVIDFGSVTGKVKLDASTGHPSGAGTLTVSLVTAWGEPTASVTIPITSANQNGPWPFSFSKATAYPKMVIEVAYNGPWSSQLHGGTVGGVSGSFNVPPNGSAAQDVTLVGTPLHPH
jgi:LGFP repeat